MTLDYASPKPGWWQKHHKMFLGAVLLLALALSALVFRAQLKSFGTRARLLYLQHQCMTHFASPSQIVYEEEPARSEELLKSPGYVKVTREADPSSPIACYLPPAWNAFGLATASNRYGIDLPRANIFLGELRTKSGQCRLLAVDLVPDHCEGIGFPESMALHAYIYTVGNLLKSPESVRHPSGTIAPLADRGKASKNLRIYRGDLDPHDPSAFTSKYEINGQMGWVRVTLVDCMLEYDTTNIEVTGSTTPSR
jgi:hypothetical protein